MELRDIEVFLTLTEELHFGRTAQRLHVTPARVSQAIKKQERRIGAPLFDRSPHHVALTAIGRQLRDDLVPVYRGLRDSLDAARRSARAQAVPAAAPLRLGIVGGGPLDDLRPVLDEFAGRHPGHPVRTRSIPFGDPFGGLRSGDIDIAVLWLPVREPDLSVGPVLFTVPVVLAVSARHRLARRESVSLEVLADEATIGTDVPDYWRAAIIPRVTPSGRPIPSGTVVTDWMDMIPLIANGEVVVPVHAYAARYHPRPDIAYVPIHDAPTANWALVWETAAESELTRAFVGVVADLGPVRL